MRRDAGEGVPSQGDATQSELTGRKLGDFLVLEKIGAGGFGAVYRASQLPLQREAVIKILHRERGDDAGLVARFLREARLATKLDHPYAAHVYAFGAEDDGILWIAMEYVRGVGLDHLIKSQGALPLGRFLPLLERLCEVVDTAHDQGIIHRDLKPANVMVLTRAGRLMPKLLDLGIARLRVETAGPVAFVAEPVMSADDLVEAPGATMTMGVPPPRPLTNTRVEGGQPPPPSVSELTPSRLTGDLRNQVMQQLSKDDALTGQLTLQGVVMGSPNFMAPEQWVDSSSASAQTDLYALGVLTYYALTYTYPFHGRSVREIARAHIQNSPPRVPDHLPEGLNAVFAKVFARDPRERHANALEFAHHLRAESGITDESASLPQLDEDVREVFVGGAAQPLAEVVAQLESARAPRQMVATARAVIAALARYLGILALAARARIGPGAGTDSAEARALFHKLRKEELTPPDWLALARNLCLPFQHTRAAHPIPEVGSSRVDLQACKLEYSIVSPK